MKIISFDPGKSTGITYWEYKKENLSLKKAEVALDYLSFNFNQLKKFDLIIVEDFLLYPGKANQLYFNRFTPVKVIGIIEYFANKYKKDIIFQNASQAKRMISNETLKRFKCYTTSPHTRDSARHCLTYFLKKYKGNFSINNILI